MINPFKSFIQNRQLDYEGSDWIIESVEAQMKGLINLKNNDNKCFLWCHIRHLNLVKTHPERTTKEDKNVINDLNYEGIKFPVSKKDLH